MPMPTPIHNASSMGMAHNELGVPDFQWWRTQTTEKPQPNGQPTVCSNGPYCPHCRYPMLKGETVCGRCGKSRA